MTVTRFAPSPTGLLHPGHAFSAYLNWRFARESGGKFLLRIEDIDHTRCRAEWTEAIFEDLAWLGIDWDDEVRVQSRHLAEYQSVCRQLWERKLAYPCFCTRRQIAEAQEAAGMSGAGLYPGTCRELGASEAEERIAAGEAYALRLNVAEASAAVPDHRLSQPVDPQLDDVVLQRKDIGASYHIAVTHDDQLQGVTHVIRGEDLHDSTPWHVLLQELLGYRRVHYHHHRLILDQGTGRRFAKSDPTVTLRALRESGVKPDSVLGGFEKQVEEEMLAAAQK